ncbi:MAG: hypothetical protein LUQ65_15415 [Candidatus Helarchaeota archaeon]|nr:hypothetical protein [Candidatus Helarchaeota archaeon]
MNKIRAKKFVQKYIANIQNDKPVEMRQLIKDSGYGVGYQVAPSRLMKTKTVLQELAKYGITPDSLASQWKTVLDAKPKKNISWDSKIKGLAHISKYVFDNPDAKINPTFQFIERFLNIQNLKEQSLEEPMIENGDENIN